MCDKYSRTTLVQYLGSPLFHNLVAPVLDTTGGGSSGQSAGEEVYSAVNFNYQLYIITLHTFLGFPTSEYAHNVSG